MVDIEIYILSNGSIAETYLRIPCDALTWDFKRALPISKNGGIMKYTGTRAMIRVEFQTPAAGTPVKLQRQLGQQSLLTIDNVFNIDEDQYYEFFTGQTYKSNVDIESVLAESGEIVEYQIQFIGYESQSFRIRALVAESCPNPCIIRTMLQHRVLPHRVYLNDGNHYNVIAAVESWDHLKELGDLMESVYGGFKLKSINQNDNTFFGCLQPKDIKDRLSETQLELLEVAYRAGYFNVPRSVTADEVAAELDISQATFSEQLRKTLTQLLEHMFGDLSRDPDRLPNPATPT